MKKPWSGSLREVSECWTEASDGAETERRGRGCLEVGGEHTHKHTVTDCEMLEVSWGAGLSDLSMWFHHMNSRSETYPQTSRHSHSDSPLSDGLKTKHSSQLKWFETDLISNANSGLTNVNSIT